VGPAVWLGVGDLGVRVETAVTQGKNDVMPGRWPVVSPRHRTGEKNTVSEFL
jgi:hypothetical protein